MLYDHYDIDALIKAAMLHPTPQIRDQLIEKELDYNGNWVGFDMANYLWHKVIPDAA